MYGVEPAIEAHDGSATGFPIKDDQIKQIGDVIDSLPSVRVRYDPTNPERSRILNEDNPRIPFVRDAAVSPAALQFAAGNHLCVSERRPRDTPARVEAAFRALSSLPRIFPETVADRRVLDSTIDRVEFARDDEVCCVFELFERFSKLSLQAMFVARKEAGQSSTSICSEYLLIGIVSVHPELIRQLGIEMEPDQIRIGSKQWHDPSEPIPDFKRKAPGVDGGRGLHWPAGDRSL